MTIVDVCGRACISRLSEVVDRSFRHFSLACFVTERGWAGHEPGYAGISISDAEFDELKPKLLISTIWEHVIIYCKAEGRFHLEAVTRPKTKKK